MATTMTEDQLQARCVKWFDEEYPSHRQMLFSVPNGGSRPMTKIGGKWIPVEANKLQATGLRPGVSDLILVLARVVVFIEMKIPGGSQSKDQENFEIRVTDRGHLYFLVDTFEDFVKLIRRLIP